MKAFMCEDFLLGSEPARRLYHDYAAQQPIYDYHCHLNPREIAEDRRFDNLGQLWLEGDHYKWRVLRSAGVAEALIKGTQRSFKEKYLAWANVVPQTLGNPVYHWTHLELRRPFGIHDRVLNSDSAEYIWHHCNEMLAQPAFSARGIMAQMNVKMVGTTDDPIDSLEYHQQLAADPTFDIEVSPSWRPDRSLKIELDGFVDYIRILEEVADTQIHHFTDLCDALSRRLDHFANHGCRIADHGMEIVRFAPIPDERTLDALLMRRLTGVMLSEQENDQYTTALTV